MSVPTSTPIPVPIRHPEGSILILDTTLRDGEQTQGVAFNAAEKVQIARLLLEQVRVDRLEVASARVSRGEQEALAQIIDWAREVGLAGRVETLGFVDHGQSVEWIRAAGGEVINLLAKGSERHCRTQLGKTLEQHAADVLENVAIARDHGLAVNCYLEDWSNGYADDRDYVYGLVERLRDRGIGHFMLPDTLGVMTPERVFTAMLDMIRRFPDCRFDFHPHNDYGLATANVVAAAQAGAASVHCTVNCLGERAGNAALAEVAVNLRDQLGLKTNIDERHLVSASVLVQYFSGKRIADNAPIIGDDVFTQTAGIHADGDKKGSLYHTRLSPERFSRRRVYALGKLAGKASLAKNLERVGITLTDAQQAAVLRRVVELGDSKASITADDLPFIIAEVLERRDYHHAALLACNVSSSLGLESTASIKVCLRGEDHTATGSGNGAFDAFINALAKVVRRQGLSLPALLDYEVRIPKGGRSDALTECTITWSAIGRAAGGSATSAGTGSPMATAERSAATAADTAAAASSYASSDAGTPASVRPGEHGNFKTRGVHANQVFAAIGATMRMLNIVIHWSIERSTSGPAVASSESCCAD